MSRIQDILEQGRARRRRAADPRARRRRDSRRRAARRPPTAAPPRSHRVDRAPRAAPAERPRRRRRAAAPSAPTRAAGPLDHRLVAALAPQSLAAEQYRSLRTRISSAENGRAIRAIIVTSPSKGDGKSLTAANLALTMAQEFQQRVLLVDADLRRPSLHQLFGAARDARPDRRPDGRRRRSTMRFVHAGRSPPDAAAGGRSGHAPRGAARVGGDAPRARHAAHALRPRHHRHAAGRRRSPTCTSLAPMVDGLLMIVRAGVTPKPAIERALVGSRSRPRCSGSC